MLRNNPSAISMLPTWVRKKLFWVVTYQVIIANDGAKLLDIRKYQTEPPKFIAKLLKEFKKVK